MNKVLRLVVILAIILPSFVQAAPKTYNLSGKIVGGGGYQVVMLFPNGSSKLAAANSAGVFSFKKLKLSQLKNSSLHLVNGGRYTGPVVLGKKGSKVSISFQGKAINSASFQLGNLQLLSGYAKVKKKLAKILYTTPRVAAVDGRPVGAGEQGVVEVSSTSQLGVRSVTAYAAGGDADLDGIPNSFDADDDGDTILDTVDSDAVGEDVPYTGLFADFRRALNANVRDGLSDSEIDGAIGGENIFSLTLFISLPSGSSIDGGHVLCSDSLSYCRRNTPLAYYGGISESSSEFRDHLWSELLNSNGYPRMEFISLNGSPVIAASIQPRVGRSEFRPGDVYTTVLTNGSRESSRRTFVLAPYFVSVPAIKEYDAGFGTVQVDYDSVTPDTGSIPGTSSGDPIVLDSNGLLTLTFWAPQRAAVRSDEDNFVDQGNLNYGLVIEDTQATCAGYYSAVSSELELVDSPLGTGDSPFANQGAKLSPYRHTVGDRPVNASNTISFTVNLKDCLARAGGSPGVHRLNLRGAGESVTGGEHAAVENFYAQIP